MGQLHFHQLQLNYNYVQLNQLLLQLQLRAITVRPSMAITITKLSIKIMGYLQ